MSLEKKRFSITRLKHLSTVEFERKDVPWKEKILDYEIETTVLTPSISTGYYPWKEKILDYEIETSLLAL